MHLVSIIYLFISASRFGPGCCLNWCLTKWQPFLLRAGAASASVSASWVQLPVPAVVPNSLLHGHSERIRCTLKSQLTAGLETSILGIWFSGGLSSVRMMVGWGDLKGLFWPKWLYELWCYPRAWGWELFLPFVCFFSGWPGWCSKAALCLIYLTSEVMLAFCLCTSKNTAMSHVECTNTVPFTTSDNMQIHMDTRQEEYAPREKKLRWKSQTEPNVLDLGTFGDLTAVSTDFDVCGAEEAQTSRGESLTHTRTVVSTPALVVAQDISLPPDPTATSLCQLQGWETWEPTLIPSQSMGSCLQRGLSTCTLGRTRPRTSQLFADHCWLLCR